MAQAQTDSVQANGNKSPESPDAAKQAAGASTALSNDANPPPPAKSTQDQVQRPDHTAHAGDENAGTSHPVVPVPDTAPLTPGIDVSQFQGTIDWPTVHQSGAQFAFIRATDGTTIQDKNFAANWEGAKHEGILVGAYHYFTTNSAVKTQIRNFVNEVHKVSAGDLPPVIDVENPHQFRHFSVKRRIKMLQDMLDGVEKELGQKPMLYMSSSFSASTLHNAPQFDKYKLYVADYTAGQPMVPQPWKDWEFWQHSKTGIVAGINKKVDLDYYNGSASDLAKPVV